MNNTLPGSQAFHQSFSSLPSGIAESGPSSNFQLPQTMQQLQVQQELQLEHMRQLQMQQLQIQQQIEMQRNQFQHAGGMNMMNMGQSSFSDMRGPPFLSPQGSEIPLKAASFNTSSLDQSMNLGDAFQGPSAQVSDYSNSHASGSGFASTRSFGGMSFLEGTMVGSFNNDMQLLQQQQQQHAFMQQQQQQQQQNHFSGPFIRVDPNQGDAGVNALPSNDGKQEQDFRARMDTGMEG
jgi:hypothetical protein